MRAISLVAALISLFVLWSGERVRVPHDLQIVVDAAAPAGATLAVRAFVLRDVDAPEGPTLARVPVQLRVLDEHDREIGWGAVLEPTALDTMEGEVRLPDVTQGTLTLEARARLDDDPELVTRRVVRITGHAPALALHGRAAGPLQMQSLGNVVRMGLTFAPTPFLPRVLGGACVPEQRCALLVWVGEPAASVTVRPHPSVSVLGASIPAHETSGLVELSLRVHGPEANIVLEARRGNELVAERAMRLPIALGEVALSLRRSVVVEGLEPGLSLALPPGREHAILDVYAPTHLAASRTLPNVSADAPLPLQRSDQERASMPPAQAGLVRIQARTDRFSSEGAGARLFYARRGDSDEQVLHTLLRAAARAPGAESTAAWLHALPAWALGDLQRTAAYVLAPLEALRAPVPTAVSGRPAQLARVDRAKHLARFGVAGCLVLAALIVGVSLMRRGLSASDEASSILAEAEGMAPGSVRVERGERLRVITLALLVALAFLTGALLIAAKSLWF